jgi:hypothetical protein
MIETFSDDDKLLVRYLFNELDKNEARELEDRMLLDDELANRAEVVEMNLIDCFVRKELTAVERVRFEEQFLSDPENRDEVNRALMFHDSLRLVRTNEQIASGPVRDQRWRPIAALALATAVVLSIVGLVVFEVRRRGHNANNLATNSSPAPNVNQSTNAPSPNSPPESVASQKEGNDSGIELARNESDKYTQYEYIHRQDMASGERGGAPAHFTLRPQAINLALMYELVDDKGAQQQVYGVTIKNQYGERVWPQNKTKEEIRPVFSKGAKRRKLIFVNIPVRVLTESGPYLLELDDEYLPAKQFTLQK